MKLSSSFHEDGNVKYVLNGHSLHLNAVGRGKVTRFYTITPSGLSLKLSTPNQNKCTSGKFHKPPAFLPTLRTNPRIAPFQYDSRHYHVHWCCYYPGAGQPARQMGRFIILRCCRRNDSRNTVHDLSLTGRGVKYYDALAFHLSTLLVPHIRPIRAHRGNKLFALSVVILLSMSGLQLNRSKSATDSGTVFLHLQLILVWLS